MSFFKVFDFEVLSGVAGAFLPSHFYESLLDKQQQQLISDILELNRNKISQLGFINTIKLEENLNKAKILEFNRKFLKNLKLRELIYVENTKFRFYREKNVHDRTLKVSDFKLPPIEVYGECSRYNVLVMEDEVEMLPQMLDFCEDCNSWTNSSYEHFCTSPSPLIPLKEKGQAGFKLSTATKFNGEYYDMSWKNKNKRSYNIKYNAGLMYHNKELLAKLKNYTTVFEQYRRVRELRLEYFAASGQIMDLISQPINRNRVSTIVWYLEIYKKFHNDPMVNFTDEDFLDMCADEASETLPTIECLSLRDCEQLVCSDSSTYSDVVECQMEETHGDDITLSQEQKSNVILTTHAEESRAEPINLGFDSWERLCSSQQIQEYYQLMSRWQAFSTVKWNVNHAVGYSLLEYTLFDKFIKDFANSPNNIMFNQYAYFRSDVEIKIVINSNKFHCGALQASFYYGSITDKHYSDRSNIFSASQLTHCIVDAASASDGILVIPYRHYKPLMGTFDRSTDTNSMQMGSLRLKVLNTLLVPSGTNPELDVNLFIRFVNPSFHGMKPRSLAENQMMGMAALVKETANLVNQIYPDPQRDNPTDPIPPKPLVPWSAHSWSLSDVISEPTNVLRLQATGNTPHPPGTLPKEPEMDIAYVNSIFGLVKQFSWDNSQVRGTHLLVIPYSPIWKMEDYPSQVVSNPDSIYCYILPPVSIMSELFAYWRGSLQYRFDFVATQFHTGRLIIAYVPRYSVKDKDKLGINELTSCDHIIVDLRDERQVMYTCNYLSDKPWWPRRKLGLNSTEVMPPGYIYVAVFNQLTATSAVSPKININLYMRGGEDFELHVPVNPQIGLSFNTKVLKIPGTNSISYLSTYGPPYTDLYVGGWHTISGRLCLRYGPVSDHVTQFRMTVNYNKIIYKKTNSNVQITHPSFVNSDKKLIDLEYLVLFSMDKSYRYGAPFDTYAKAKAFSNKLDEFGIADATAVALMLTGRGDGNYIPRTQIFWQPATSVEAQGNEERTEVAGTRVQIHNDLMSTSNGLFTFGETITNLKQICRRYMPYGQFVSTTKGNSNPSLADFAFAVMPQGLDLKITNLDGSEYIYGNRVRDGPIPVIASGYRFFRGSVRFRIIITGSEEGVFWVQHRPEYNIRSTSIFIPEQTHVDAVFQPGYAMMIQLTQVNNVVEFEVPFYLPGQFGLLQRPDLTKLEDAVHYSMGTVYCGFDTMKGLPKNIPYVAQVFYSIGDDMSFSVFQGFPPVFDLTFMNEISHHSLYQVEAQGPIDSFTNYITKKTKEAVKDQINETVTMMSQPGSSTTDDVNAIPDESIVDLVKRYIGDVSQEKQQVIIGIVTHLVHSLIHPEIGQIAWSIASIFVHMGVLALSVLDTFVKMLKRLIGSFDFLAKKAKKSESAARPAVVSQSEEDLTEAAFVSTCVTGMLALVGATNKPLPKSLPNFATYLYQGLPKFSMTANGLFTFMKNNILMFKKMWYWLVAYFNSDYVIYKELHGASAEVIKFIRKVQWCLDARNKQQVLTDPKATLQAYEMANIASSYLAKRSLSKIQKSMPLFDGYCHKIIKLRDELVSLMISPAIRFEPFVIALSGPPNCGKSHLAHTLARELLKSIDYKSYEELVYTRTPGNAYWNGLRNQAVCLFDDFLNITDPNFALIQIGELFCLKSKAVFNPPMAAIEEKKLRYNPLIVFLLSNEAYPVIQGVASPEAWRRRRDILFKVEKLPEYANKHPRTLSKTESATYKHLKFTQYLDPSGGADGNNQFLAPESINYQELLSKLILEFNNYFNEECIQYDTVIGKIKEFYPDNVLETTDYVKEIEEFIVQQNNARIPPCELVEIKNKLKELQEETYSADMTRFVKRSLLEQEKKRLQDIVDNQLTPLAPTAGPSNVVAQGPGDPGDIVETCDCFKVLKLGSCDGCVNDKIVFRANLGSRFKVKDTQAYLEQPCSPTCMFVEYPEFMRDFVFTKFKRQLLDLPRNKFPTWLVERYDNLKASDINNQNQVTYMTPAEIDQLVINEIQDPTWYEKLWMNVPTWGTIFKWLVKITAIFGAIGALIRIAGYMFASPDNAEAQILYAEGDKKCASSWSHMWNEDITIAEEESGGYKLGTVGGKVNPQVPIKAIAEASDQQNEVIQNKIVRNTFFLMCEYGPPGARLSKCFRCVGLIGHHFLLLDHYVYFLKSCVNLKSYFVKDGVMLNIPNSYLENLSKFNNSTLVVSKIDVRIPAFANIIKFFVRSSQTANLAPQANLYEYVYNQNAERFDMRIRAFDRIRRQDQLEVGNDDNSVTFVNTVYAYPYSGRGVCGSVLVSNSNLVSPILGIHVAGLRDGNEGYAEAVVYESFEYLVKIQKTEVIANSAYSTILLDKEPIMFLDGNIQQLGVIPREDACYPPNESRLCLTECAGEFGEITYDRPVLSSKDERIKDNPFSPLLEGCKYHTTPCDSFPEVLSDRAIADVKEMILAYVKPQRLSIGKLTYEEAICGIAGNPLYDKLPMDTSEGFPWLKRRPIGASNKSWMFDMTLTPEGFKLNSIDSELFAVMEYKDRKRREGYCFETVFVDVLKDAKLPKEKVLLPGKTRIFAVSPVDFSIQQRQYTMDFAVGYMNARILTEHAIGIDIYSLETNKMVNHMLQHSKFMVCGDYSKFGDQLYAKFVQAVYEIIYEWYIMHECDDLGFKNVLSAFSYEVSYATHLMLNQLYKSFGGMPSGNPLTVIINSCVNSMYIRVIWQKIMLNVSLNLIDMASFRENVRMITYGDDLWLSVKEEVLPYFNGLTLSEHFAEFKIKFTNSLKDGNMLPYTLINDPATTFLKCTFHKHPYRSNIWMARMEKRVVEETCNWTWNTWKDIRSSSMEACKAMMELSFGHGKEYYEQRRKLVVEYWARKGALLTIADWDAVDLRIYGLE